MHVCKPYTNTGPRPAVSYTICEQTPGLILWSYSVESQLLHCLDGEDLKEGFQLTEKKKRKKNSQNISYKETEFFMEKINYHLEQL